MPVTFENLKFDDLESIEREVRGVAAHLYGLMDMLMEVETGPDATLDQASIDHLDHALEDAGVTLDKGIDKMLNSMWHKLHSDEKVKLLEARQRDDQ